MRGSIHIIATYHSSNGVVTETDGYSSVGNIDNPNTRKRLITAAIWYGAYDHVVNHHGNSDWTITHLRIYIKYQEDGHYHTKRIRKINEDNKTITKLENKTHKHYLKNNDENIVLNKNEEMKKMTETKTYNKIEEKNIIREFDRLSPEQKQLLIKKLQKRV